MNEVINSVIVDSATKITVSIVEGIYRDIRSWIEERNKKYDLLHLATKKYYSNLYNRYNVVKIVGMHEPVELDKLFVQVNILEKITSKFRLDIKELNNTINWATRSFGVKKETKSAEEAVSELDKFIVLGKPGSGKTTFLKYTALRSIQNKKSERIPVFVTLKKYSESDLTLIDYIAEEFDVCGFPEAKLFIERMLLNGKFQLLFDGLDEVTQNIQWKVVNDLVKLSDKYSMNQFIISCRVAAYNHTFSQFTDIEIADFDYRQIKKFIGNWFSHDSRSGIAEKCIDKIENNYSLKDLAQIPLLLSLLCIVFDDNFDFPANKAELYEESFSILLKKWDASRGIKRKSIYKQLSAKKKTDLLCSIAFESFVKKEYFFNKRGILDYVKSYTSDLSFDLDNTLSIDNEEILNEIESQHGLIVKISKNIYSFSHLTFQEFLTAKYITQCKSHEEIDNILSMYLNDTRWREIFILIGGLLPRADRFLMKIYEMASSITNNPEFNRVYSHIPKFFRTSKKKNIIEDFFCILFYNFHIVLTNNKTNPDIKNLAIDLEFLIDRFSELLEFGRFKSDLSQVKILIRDINQTLKNKKNYDVLKGRGFNLARFIDRDLQRGSAEERAIEANLEIDMGCFSELIKNLKKFVYEYMIIFECLGNDAYIRNETRKMLRENFFIFDM